MREGKNMGIMITLKKTYPRKLDIPRNALPVAPHAALHVHHMGGVAKGAHALGDLLALSGETLVLVVRCCHILGSLLQAWRHLGRAAWTTLGRLTIGVVEALVHPLERLFSLRPRPWPQPAV